MLFVLYWWTIHSFILLKIHSQNVLNLGRDEATWYFVFIIKFASISLKVNVHPLSIIILPFSHLYNICCCCYMAVRHVSIHIWHCKTILRPVQHNSWNNYHHCCQIDNRTLTTSVPLLNWAKNLVLESFRHFFEFKNWNTCPSHS